MINSNFNVHSTDIYAINMGKEYPIIKPKQDSSTEWSLIGTTTSFGEASNPHEITQLAKQLFNEVKDRPEQNIEHLGQIKKILSECQKVYAKNTNYSLLERIKSIFGYGKRAGLSEAAELERKINDELEVVNQVKELPNFISTIQTEKEAQEFLQQKVYQPDSTIFWYDSQNHRVVCTKLIVENKNSKLTKYKFDHKVFTQSHELSKHISELHYDGLHELKPEDRYYKERLTDKMSEELREYHNYFMEPYISEYALDGVIKNKLASQIKESPDGARFLIEEYAGSNIHWGQYVIEVLPDAQESARKESDKYHYTNHFCLKADGESKEFIVWPKDSQNFTSYTPPKNAIHYTKIEDLIRDFGARKFPKRF